MKTSNKILLGILVTALLLFVTLHATIFVKYKDGQFVSKELSGRHSPSETVPLLKSIKYVSLENVFIELTKADTQVLYLPGNNGMAEDVKYAQRGDSLFVFCTKNENVKMQAKLTLNSDAFVKATSSSISLKSVNNNEHPSFELETNNSRLEIAYGNAGQNQFTTLKVKASGNSNVFIQNAGFRSAEISLEGSNLDLYNSIVEDFKLKNDNASRVNIYNSNISLIDK